jgi:hypothetical protein
VVEGARLLSEWRVISLPEGSNPSLSATQHPSCHSRGGVRRVCGPFSLLDNENSPGSRLLNRSVDPECDPGGDQLWLGKALRKGLVEGAEFRGPVVGTALASKQVHEVGCGA